MDPFVYTAILFIKFCSAFHVDQVCGVEMCRRICQLRECCFVSYDENHLRCLPTIKYPIVVEGESADSATCTVLTRRVETRTQGEQVVSDCIIGYMGDTEEEAPTSADLFKAYVEDDVCLARFIITTKGLSIDLEQRDENGFTVLMRAAYDGNKEMFDLFVRAGASLSVKNSYNQTLLMLAIDKVGNIDIVKQIIKDPDIDINSADQDGLTALIYSCESTDSVIFKLIVEAGGSVGVVDNDGHGVLYSACSLGYLEVTKHILTHYKIEEYKSISNDVDNLLKINIVLGSLEIVDLLVKHGADLTIVDSNNNSMLALACQSGITAMVEYVLSKKCVPVDIRGRDGSTPFLGAAFKATAQIMEMLVENGCNTSAVDYNGRNVLHYGSESRNLDNLKYILRKEFIKDINIKSHHGLTALLYAAGSNNTDGFDLLVSSGADLTAVDNKHHNSLHLACRMGHINMVRHILQLSDGNVHNVHHLSVNSRGEGGKTPLFEATISGFIEIMDLLVSHGGDTHATDDDGDAILHKAICTGEDNVVWHILDKHYVSIESRGKYGYTPIHTAAFYGKMSIFMFLVARGCNKYALDDFEDNIFHLSCCGGNVNMVKHIHEEWYFDHSELRGWIGRTAMLLAAYYGHEEVVKYLLNVGCDISAVDDEGNNALHLAIMRDHEELAVYLIEEHVLDINLRNLDGSTPLMVASRKGHHLIFSKLPKGLF